MSKEINPTIPVFNKETKQERKRIPMSVPRQKLSVPPVPGYRLFWVMGTPEKMMQAEQGGYEYVSADEACLTNFDFGGNTYLDGNTDLGTRVSVIAGREIGYDNQPIRLYLMKIKQEWYEEDMKLKEASTDSTLAAIKGGYQGDNVDPQSRYVSQRSNLNFFNPTRRP